MVRLLGVGPILGRGFLPDEGHVGGARAIVLSHPEWHAGVVGIVWFREWLPADEHQVNYGPDIAPGTQLFFCRALEPDGYSRTGIGLGPRRPLRRRTGIISPGVKGPAISQGSSCP